MRSMEPGYRPPRRLRRWRLPWRRGAAGKRSPSPSPEPGRIIQFPVSPLRFDPPPAAPPHEPPSPWPGGEPRSHSLRAAFLAALLITALITGSLFGLVRQVQIMQHQIHLQPATVAFDVLIPRAHGQGAGGVTVQTNHTEGLIGFRYVACPRTALGAFRFTIALADDPGTWQRIVDRRTSDTRSFSVDPGRAYRLSVTVPASSGCRDWTLASNPSGNRIP